MTPDELLDLPLDDNVANADTVRELLMLALQELWVDHVNLGKRVWGSSAWRSPVYAALIRAGVVAGAIDDEYGYIDQLDQPMADQHILHALRKM